jgi:hypothetical protein
MSKIRRPEKCDKCRWYSRHHMADYCTRDDWADTKIQNLWACPMGKWTTPEETK